jgi:glycosyltransferase involved in cell wall biosynthesis
MKTIGILHYQVGRTDGVSLEIEKWKHVLEQMGHTVHLCAGDLGTAEGTLIEEMYHHRPDARRLYYNTFCQLRDYADESAYHSELYRTTDGIAESIHAFVEEKGIDLLIPQNLWSVAAHPSVSIALDQVMRTQKLPALAHNHDFYWERVDGVALTCATAVELADRYLPPRHPLARHVVINSLAQRALLERKGIPSTVVPNVFDFDGPPWQPDEYNQDFRECIGLDENDIFVLQATRIVRRKGIELAVDFVQALDTPARRAKLRARGLYDGRRFNHDSRIVLVLAGYARDDTTGQYIGNLREKINRAGIDAIFVEDMIGACRGAEGERKRYALWDAYVFADLVTYPSLWEGWGNQFLETMRARLPIVLFEYPVYHFDIENHGFRVISLGNLLASRDNLGLVQVSPPVIEQAADQAVELLTNFRLRQEIVDHNYQICRQHYSLQALRGYLSPLLEA